ncbi:MAG: EFR1 family ferrodoxin [Oscillospiraceae bacterium]|jgi:ferredoxin|nr:EFR1 family ferrodoxin [Oscillospiraceae bacterium]
MANRVYFFTGTGNSLRVARSIAGALDDCEVIAIHKGAASTVPESLERVGFVFPVYFWGLPGMAAEFLRGISLPEQGGTYYFAVATFGGIIGNALPQVKRLLADKGITLNYGGGVCSYRNAVVYYEMKQDVEAVTRKAEARAQKVVSAVVAKKKKRVGRGIKKIFQLNADNIAAFHAMALHYTISGDCVGCGLCASVCPAENILFQDGKPVFGDACEYCLACIQHCPKRAINDGDKTVTRGRYTHPNVTADMIACYYKSNNETHES